MSGYSEDLRVKVVGYLKKRAHHKRDGGKMKANRHLLFPLL